VDPEQRATEGLACFGVGCVEVREGAVRAVTRVADESLMDGDEVARQFILGEKTASVCLLTRWVDKEGREFVRLPDGRNLSVVEWDVQFDLLGHKYSGVLLQVGRRIAGESWCVPASMPKGLPERVRTWRKDLGDGVPLIVAGGIGCPSDARVLVGAGADVLLIDAGLVFRGPGLVKRCNEALLPVTNSSAIVKRDVPLFRRARFWATTLGGALIVGGFAALVLALTRVLLPYDENFLGISADVLRRNTPLLFAFMAHDRATLAGTMVGLGWIYVMLAWYGTHGSRTAIVTSALTGFASFFGFFSFGYFDTLHAFVAAVLLQFTIQIMVAADTESEAAPRLDVEDSAWRRAQWGQLLWVVHAVGLLIAGTVILSVGLTAVFVSEDLNFLCVTAQQAEAWGLKVMGVVAHDRATLGGMLLSSGVAMLLPVLWCFRRGERWLWHALLGLGLPAYGAALGIHLAVGYVDWRHMVPAVVGLLLWLAGLGLSKRYLTNSVSIQPSQFRPSSTHLSPIS
jgi:hypothetical protein